MKFIVSSSALLKSLQTIGGVVSTNSTLPILDDFLFELDEEKLTISASDLETTMTVTIEPEKIEEPGSVAIPAKMLLDTLKTFANIPLSFKINDETSAVEISAGEGKFKLSGHKSDEFPKIPEIQDAKGIEISPDLFAEAINKTIFATGNDDLRPVMSGVYCHFTPDNLIFVATDAHKLVRYTRNDAKAEEEAAFILPKKPLNQLKNILANEEDSIKIEFNESNAFFSCGNINLICRLIEGKYPNYEAVIPKENPNNLTIQRQMLLSAIRRVSIFANQSTHQVRFKIAGQELFLSAEDVDYSNEAKERLDCKYEGEDMEIGFNSRFIIEMLNNMDTEQVTFEMSTPNRAGIILPFENETEGEDVLMLVMPVMLNA